LTFNGENRKEAEGFTRNGPANFAEDLAEKAKISEETWKTLKVFRTVEILYQIAKYYMSVRS